MKTELRIIQVMLALLCAYQTFGTEYDIMYLSWIFIACVLTGRAVAPPIIKTVEDIIKLKKRLK